MISVPATPITEQDLRTAFFTGVAEAARLLLRAQRASVAMLDERAGELVFEAIAGRGGDELLGARFPADTGIAGQALRESVTVSVPDLSGSEHFAQDIAVESGYRPDAIVVAPFRRAGRAVGVLSVLDPGSIPASERDAVLAVLVRHAEGVLSVVDELVAPIGSEAEPRPGETSAR